MLNNCNYCGTDDLSIKSENGKFYVECNCGARGMFKRTEIEAERIWNRINEVSDYERFKSILSNSDYSSDFTESSSSIEFQGDIIPTKDICILNTDTESVNAVFLESTEDLVGIIKT